MEAENLKAFQQFIYQLLANFMEPDRAKRYIDQESMNKWIQAFTHESINPAFNYENLETLGDAILKSVFVVYLKNRFKDIDKDTITNMNSYYMAKVYQRGLSKGLGFKDWIRSTKTTISVLEDTFESFVGALFEISEQKDNLGRGYINCTNFITWLFKTIKIDLSLVTAKKTFIDQTFRRLGLGTVELITIRSKRGDYAYQLEITPVAQHYFAQHGISFESTLGIGYGGTSKEAKKNAYEDAFNRMQKAGITREWVNKERLQWDLSLAEFQPYLQQARENLKKLGYDSMYFNVPRNLITESDRSVSLIGIKEQTNEHIVLDSLITNDEVGAKTLLLKRLAERKIP